MTFIQPPDDYKVTERQRPWWRWFCELWTPHPKKNDRYRAWREFKRLQPGPTLWFEIKHAHAEQVKDPRWHEDRCRFAPRLADWIKDKRWEDEGRGDTFEDPDYKRPSLEQILEAQENRKP